MDLKPYPYSREVVIVSMRLYIAGPMAGHPEWNYPAFFTAEAELAALGHDPVNPARLDGDTVEAAVAAAGTPEAPVHTWEWYLRSSLGNLAAADGVVLLPGWQSSRGARLEVHLAQALGIPLFILRDGRLRPRVRVIGLSGYARSGKDTIGHFLGERGYVRASFGDHIRTALYTLNPLVGEDRRLADVIDTYGWEQAKVERPEVRELLQRLGSEVGRDLIDQNVWVDLTLRNLPDGANVVVTDCRFPNEADVVKRLGGEIWRVMRPGHGPANNHPSEVGLDSWAFDRVFVNDTTREELRERVLGVIDEMHA